MKVRLISDLSSRFKDLKVLREENPTKTTSKNVKLVDTQTVPFFEVK